MRRPEADRNFSSELRILSFSLGSRSAGGSSTGDGLSGS